MSTFVVAFKMYRIANKQFISIYFHPILKNFEDSVERMPVNIQGVPLLFLDREVGSSSDKDIVS